MRSCDVVIAGGGMVGSTLACALGETGLDVLVLEARQPQPYIRDAAFGLRVSAISARSETLFRDLQVWPLIESKRLCPFYEMHVWDAGGRGSIHFNCTELAEPRLGHIIENRVIQAALLERLQALGNVEFMAPARLHSATVHEHGAEIVLDDDTHLSARLLVGADGPESRVREQAGIDFAITSYQQTALVANIQTEHSHRHTAWQRFLTSGPLAFLPLADGSSSIVWSADDDRANALLEMPAEDFEQELSQAFDYQLGFVKLVSERASFKLRGGQARRYVAPRVALVGDAAHLVHPLAGQGANLGLLDAAALASGLTGSGRDPGSLFVLRRYERARRGENVAMMRAMEGFKFLFGSDDAARRWLRTAGLNAANAAAPVKNLFVRKAMGLL